MVVTPAAVVSLAEAVLPVAAVPPEEVAIRHSYNRCTRLNNHYHIPESRYSHSRCRIKNRYVCLLSNRKSCHLLLDL